MREKDSIEKDGPLSKDIIQRWNNNTSTSSAPPQGKQDRMQVM